VTKEIGPATIGSMSESISGNSDGGCAENSAIVNKSNSVVEPEKRRYKNPYGCSKDKSVLANLAVFERLTQNSHFRTM